MKASPLFLRTMAAARYLRATGERFDKSWRHAQPGTPKSAYYARVCTFAANDIADDPKRAKEWRKYL
jgi:hypothetical protein